MKTPTRGFAPPPEIIRFFEQKNVEPSFSWQDKWAEDHAHTFVVAKATELELVKAFRDSLLASQERGEGLESWKKRIVPELQRLGWYGPRRVDDPTGKWESRIVDFSKPRRLQTIFWSNVRSARAAGQWERIQRTKAGLPYILYFRTTAQEPRPEHLAWAGLILPVDDPFWATHFPPNGWGCKCSVRQIARVEYEKLKGQDGYSTDAPAIEYKTFVNKRTGEVTQVPAGIDPGWHTNPGLARAKTLIDNVTARLEAAGEQAARARIAEIVASPAAQVLMGLKNEPLALPVSTAGRFVAEMKAASNIIVAFNSTMARKVDKHKAVDPKTFRYIQPVVDEGETIDEGRGANFRTVLHEIDGAWWKLVLKRSATGYLRVQTFFRTRLDEVRRLRRKTGGRS